MQKIIPTNQAFNDTTFEFSLSSNKNQNCEQVE